MKKSTKWRNGNGEMLGFSIIAIAVCSIFLIMVSFLQLSVGLNAITKASNVVARAAAICTSEEDALKQSQLVAESAITYTGLDEIKTSIDYATSDTEWSPGVFVRVNISARVHTLAPIASHTQEKSVLVCIENKKGLRGDNIDEQVWNFFRDNGFSAEATAGIMGNMFQESGGYTGQLDPACIQGMGRGPAAGICQWENYNTKSSRWKDLDNYCAGKGKEWTDLESQLEFLILELMGRDSYTLFLLNKHYGGFENFKNATDINWATEAFERSFERAGKPVMEVRYAKAREYYYRYAH